MSVEGVFQVQGTACAKSIDSYSNATGVKKAKGCWNQKPGEADSSLSRTKGNHKVF